MPVYPVNLRIEGKACAVIGGGRIAERKVRSLLTAGAAVTVISPRLTEALQALAATRMISYIEGPYQAGQLTSYFIVICAADDAAVNKEAAREAAACGALVNQAADDADGDFSVPAQVRRGDLLLTVSTGGQSPVLAKQIQQELAEQYGEEYALYLELAGRLRQQLKEQLPFSTQRELFWRQAIDRDILVLLKQGKLKEAEERIQHAAGCFGTQS